MDGHTEEGGYQVTLTLTGDMLEELAKLIGLAKLMNGRNPLTAKRPEPFDILAH